MQPATQTCHMSCLVTGPSDQTHHSSLLIYFVTRLLGTLCSRTVSAPQSLARKHSLYGRTRHTAVTAYCRIVCPFLPHFRPFETHLTRAFGLPTLLSPATQRQRSHRSYVTYTLPHRLPRLLSSSTGLPPTTASAPRAHRTELGDPRPVSGGHSSAT